MPAGLSKAGEDYARAVCVPKGQEGTAYESLTAQQQLCVQKVGISFQNDIEQALGYGTGTPGATGEIKPLHKHAPERYALNNPEGQTVAHVVVEPDGDIDVCTVGRNCIQVVENGGPKEFESLRKTLTDNGFTLEPGW